jgi:hypothetical protein
VRKRLNFYALLCFLIYPPLFADHDDKVSSTVEDLLDQAFIAPCGVSRNEVLRKLIVEYNLDPNYMYKNKSLKWERTLLHLAVSHKWEEEVDLLLKKGADPNQSSNIEERKESPLAAAIDRRTQSDTRISEPIIRNLVAHKANLFKYINQADSRLFTWIDSQVELKEILSDMIADEVCRKKCQER